MKYILLFLTAIFLYANTYSLQLYTSKGIKHAQRYLSNTNYPDSFLYKTDNGYYTVRVGLFQRAKEAFNFAKQKGIEHFSIVKTDPKKIKLSDITKKPSQISKQKEAPEINQYLTSCKSMLHCEEEKDHPWELSRKEFEKKIAVVLPPSLLDEINITKQENNQSNQFHPFSYLRFYIDPTLTCTLGQKPINQKRLKAHSLNLKLGLQYYYLFHPNWHFYTDDRVVLYYKKSNSNKKSGAYLDIRELYIKSNRLFDNRANLLIGREYLSDYRGWIFRNSLDILKIFNRRDLWLYNIIFGTRLNKLRIFNTVERDVDIKNIKFIYAKVDYQYLYLQHFKPFFLFEKSSKLYNKERWYGLSFYGDLYKDNGDMLRYWFDVALNKNRQNSKKWAYDGGAIYKPIEKKYSLGLGYATGSNGFHQPLISRNKSNYLNYNTSMRYYGEFLDPQLNNLSIFSLYGFYDIESFQTVAASWHYYQRHSKNDPIFSSSYTVAPNNQQNSIGSEIDLYYNYLAPNRKHFQFILGYFFGMNAYTNQATQKDGCLVRLNYRYYW